MKKLLFILALTALFACKKEACYTCTLKYTTTTSGGPNASRVDVSTATLNKCDMTDKEIERFISETATTATVTSGSITARTVTTCTCVEQ